MISMEQRLWDWAAWSVDMNALGCKSPSLGLIRQCEGGGRGAVALSDEQAMRIEQAVLRLKQRDGELYLALMLYFGLIEKGAARGSFTATGRALGCSKLVAQQRVTAAIAWVDGQLSALAA